jgi:hypothetical protein
MAKHLVNDKGQTEAEPWTFPAAFTSDVQSWGRVHKSVHDAVSAVTQTGSSAAAPNREEALVWIDESEKYRDLSNPGLGFGTILDFGPFDALDQNALVMETIASAKEGQRLLGVLRAQAGLTGGEEVGGAVNNPLPPEPPGDVKMFVGGAVVAGLGLLAYLATRD